MTWEMSNVVRMRVDREPSACPETDFPAFIGGVKMCPVVKCGGMGWRHLRGYHVLEDFEPGSLEVAAVIDPELARADFVAGEVEERFGARPQTFRSLEDALSGCPDLSVLDIVVATHGTLPWHGADD